MKTLIMAAILAAVLGAHAQDAPKVYLTAASNGNTWNALRDQSQEMAKDLAKACPEVQVTTNQNADYHLSLNHIEVGLFVRDNQIAVTDMFGNLLSTKEEGSVRGGAKGACALILSDWSNQAGNRQRLISGINSTFQRGGVVGYAEVSGDKLTVHSERASLMRFRMILASQWEISMVRRSGIATFVYTNDADQDFIYDVKSGHILSPTTQQASQGTN